MPRVEIDRHGTKRYFDDNGRLWREDGPAMIKPNGELWYSGNDSEVASYDVYPDGTKHCFQYYNLHRYDGPSSDSPNGEKYWHFQGQPIWPELK